MTHNELYRILDRFFNYIQDRHMSTDTQTIQAIHESPSLIPSGLVITPTKWKFMVRSVLRGKNIMLTGPTGTGKTLAAKTVADMLDRPLFYFNLGASQDPRSTLIGNTHYNKDTGTYFQDSLFVQAIQTPNTVILMDELSRAHPEAWNILMTVLDETQRYLRIDESPNTPVVKVAEGVSFIATANVGMEYTATRTIDRAITDRFQLLEMDILTVQQHVGLITSMYPTISESDATVLGEMHHGILREYVSDHNRISTVISTRIILATAGLMADGFSISESAELCIYPIYSAVGGVSSERTLVRQILQKFIPDTDLVDSNMFTQSDVG